MVMNIRVTNLTLVSQKSYVRDYTTPHNFPASLPNGRIITVMTMMEAQDCAVGPSRFELLNYDSPAFDFRGAE